MICKECGGTGEKAYGSTATYHGGVGGQMITAGTCNKCWGSGDSDNPFLDPRRGGTIEQQREFNDLVKNRLGHVCLQCGYHSVDAGAGHTADYWRHAMMEHGVNSGVEHEEEPKDA